MRIVIPFATPEGMVAIETAADAFTYVIKTWGRSRLVVCPVLSFDSIKTLDGPISRDDP
jgi:hypothetical protein